ncbi:MAG TPA: ankyrin repeat domain-containing protein [Pyrinomonadaceae bacterium]|nr:ankyrin repeat domain-containing protein [Pyrinomonadaceae bacterium]
MIRTKTQCFLHLAFLLVVIPLPVSAQQQKPDEIKGQLYDAINTGDAQTFASLIGLVGQQDRDNFLLYVLSQSQKDPLEIVRVLIEKGADVNTPSRSETALMRAAGKGYVDIVRLLLSKGAQVNANVDDGTPLMVAVRRGDIEIMKILLAAGADVNLVHRVGDQALMMAARQRSLRTPSAEPNAEMVELLLAHGADPKARGDWNRTALMSANTAAKVKLLLAKGAEIDAQDKDGQTALMHAAERGDAAVAGALLDSGASVNLVDNEGLTALLYSLDDENMALGDERQTLPARRLEVARVILLAKDADVNAANQDGETPLIRAVRLANVDVIKALLAKRADANRSDVFGDTAVTLAYNSDNAEIGKLLPLPSLKRQPPNVLNAFLRAAIEKKDEAKVKELLTAGADPNHEYGISYNHKSIKRTVLILAAGVGHAGIVQLLLDKGANPNAKGLLYGSEHGLEYGTALEAAERSKHVEVAALLKKVRQD